LREIWSVIAHWQEIPFGIPASAAKILTNIAKKR